MKVSWTVPALNHLKNLFEYISADNPGAAARTVFRIREVVRHNARMAYAARIGRVDGTREMAVTGTPSIVAYRIVEDSIHILAVFRGARQWPKTF